MFNLLLSEIEAVPKLPPRNLGTFSVYLVSANRDLLVNRLRSTEACASKVIKIFIELREPELLLIVLVSKDSLSQLKLLLSDLIYEIHEKNPLKSSTVHNLLVVGFSFPGGVETLSASKIRNNLTVNNSVFSGLSFTIGRIYSKGRNKCFVLKFLNSEHCDKVKNEKVLSLFGCLLDVYDFVPLAFCIRCCQLGHTETSCRFPLVTICMRCAEDHVFADCPHRHDKNALFKCFNCFRKGYDSNHLASEVICSHRLDIMNHLVSSSASKST